MNIVAARPSIIVECITHAYSKSRPAFLWGPPGIGKSEMFNQVTKKLGIGLIDFRLAMRDPTDIKGFPVPDMESKTMRFMRDAELPTKGEGILFMDELNSATPATQAAAMQLTLTRHIGDYVLPKGWTVFGAGNRIGDRGVTYQMPTPLANRLWHLEVEPSVDDWVDWALSNGVSPQLIAYHRWKRDALYTFDSKTASHAFGTPRSWVSTDDIVHETNLSTAAKHTLLKGAVGVGEGSGYWAFLQTIEKLPTIDNILKNPTKVAIPDSPDILFAVCTMLASHTAVRNFPTLHEYGERLPMDFYVVYMRDILARVDGIDTHPVYQKWALENHSKIV